MALQTSEKSMASARASEALRLPQRYASVDALRGLIMIVMALDHSSAFIARQHGVEFWSGAMSSYWAAFPFLTRWITHLCAPGFFFLMGAGAYWFFASRIDAGVPPSAVMRKLAVRGLLLLVIGQFFEGPMIFLQGALQPASAPLNTITAAPPNDGTSLFWGLIVLSGLGMVLMVCAVLLRLPPWTWLLTASLCVLATNSLLPAEGEPFPLWYAILLAPGLAQHVFVLYPLVPWLAGAAAGMYFGHWWRRMPDQAGRRVGYLGAIVLAAGIALRAAGGWGNLRPPRDSGWIEFLNNVKYPPSLVFWLMAIGINLLFLAAIERLPQRWKGPQSIWLVFGQTPLFFYLAHFALLAAAGFAFFPKAAALETAWVVWAIVLAAVYPLCLWYRRFKRSTPADSLWRLF